MPFEPTPVLPPNPAVKVFFSGLLILKPSDDGNSCEVFVHRSAPAHHLTIEVRRKKENRPDEIMMRHVGPLTFGVALSATPGQKPIHGFFIQKITNGQKGVRKYLPDAPPGPDEPQSLELAVNMDSLKFHNGNPEIGAPAPGEAPRKLLDIDPLGARPSIFINDGTFYTAAMTRPDIEIKLKQEGAADKVLEPFASLIGANIYLEDGTNVVVRWRHQGKFEALELKKPAPGVSYEIYIVNDPLYENDSEDEPKHDEFREYYKILPEVPTSEQFRLDVKPLAATIERGTTKAPCMSVIIGGGG